MSSDYRNTDYCCSLVELDLKKSLLNMEVFKAHPNQKIVYNKIRDKNGPFKAKFMHIYNYKCGYCGNSIDSINSTLFEIDHYICESSFESKELAGEISNLVLSCYDCNRAKSSYFIKESYRTILNPDSQYIASVFERDEMFYIKVSEKYQGDADVVQFYDKLKLGFQSRRLDFLLMNIAGLCKKIDGHPGADSLNVVFRKLQLKRNLTSCKEFDPDYALAEA